MLRAWLASVMVVALVLVVGCGGPAAPAPEPAKKGTVEVRVPVAEPKPAVKPETKPEAKPEAKPETKPETKPEVKPEVKPEAKPEVKPEVKPEAKAALKELKPGLLAVDLSQVCNNDGITGEDDRKDSDFDQWKQSFPAENLPNAGLFEPKDTKTAFDFPSKEKGKKNNVACAGQTIALDGKAKELCLLVSATDADQQEKLTINYADGTVQADLKVTDWCKAAQFGEKTGVESAQRVAVDTEGKGEYSKEDKKCCIWVVTMPLDPNRELKSVKLPFCSLVHIFAMTVVR